MESAMIMKIMMRCKHVNKKVIFFDIDGTLVNFEGNMPDSTGVALKRAKQNGHAICICTGRNRSSVYEFLEEYDFDGWVCAAGAYVEYQNKVLSHRVIEREKLEKAVGFFEREHILYGVQCAGDSVTTPEGFHEIKRFFKTKFPLDEERLQQFYESLTIEENPGLREDAEKLIYYESELGLDVVRKALGTSFEVTATSFEKPDETSGEVTQTGITKSYGMKVIADYLGIDREDIIAFGDGPNDLDMMQYAGTGVAMGNAGDYVKRVADLVTAHIDSNGIYTAMERLHLI